MEYINVDKRKEFLEKAEDLADTIVRKTRRHLPHIARFCLVATFIEDAFRLVLQWGDQVNYISALWRVYGFFAGIFILLNIAMQAAGAGLVIVRYHVKVGVGILMANVALQTFGYGMLSSIFVLRNLSLVGSLILLLAENQEVNNRLVYAGLPSSGQTGPNQYLQLSGRILIIFMFVSSAYFSFDALLHVIYMAFCFAFLLCVAVGYKTKLCALVLVVALSLENLIYNDFWSESIGSNMWDYLKYDFFQTLSVIGGLLFIVAYGPGGVSVDDYKKRW